METLAIRRQATHFDISGAGTAIEEANGMGFFRQQPSHRRLLTTRYTPRQPACRHRSHPSRYLQRQGFLLVIFLAVFPRAYFRQRYASRSQSSQREKIMFMFLLAQKKSARCSRRRVSQQATRDIFSAIHHAR